MVQMIQKKSIKIFTDGACSGNPGPGGWGSIVALANNTVVELGGSQLNTTNNRMELIAVIQAFVYIQHQEDSINVYTDSVYVIRGITQWIWGWKKRGWKTAEGSDVLNKDLWQFLSQLVHSRDKNKVQWHYVRGHRGNPGNERCDVIAVAFSQKKRIQLFNGTSFEYDVDLEEIPEDTSLPEMKPVKEKTKAYCYLSIVNGKVEKHSDWSACEKRVKGKSGAKFKKATSEEDALEIIRNWGASF